MRLLKRTDAMLASLTAILLVPGLSVSRLAAQQVPQGVFAKRPVLKEYAMLAGAVPGCSNVQQETTSADAAAVPQQKVCKVPPTPHYVQYRAFIPADHLVVYPSPCFIGQAIASLIPPPTPFPVPMGSIMVLGDASSFSTHYRIKEYANLAISSTGPATELPVLKVPSVSYNFEFPSSPIAGLGADISSGDFNIPAMFFQCYHEQNTGSSSLTNINGTTSSTAANQASVTFSGSGTDPLFADPVAPIQFNLTVSINTATNQATITGSHTCFPSHEIVIGTQVVYQKNPVFVSWAVLSACLLTYPVVETQVNCTVPLDGVSKCP
jgi:hypothetical protein